MSYVKLRNGTRSVPCGLWYGSSLTPRNIGIWLRAGIRMADHRLILPAEHVKSHTHSDEHETQDDHNGQYVGVRHVSHRPRACGREEESG